MDERQVAIFINREIERAVLIAQRRPLEVRQSRISGSRNEYRFAAHGNRKMRFVGNREIERITSD